MILPTGGVTVPHRPSTSEASGLIMPLNSSTTVSHPSRAISSPLPQPVHPQGAGWPSQAMPHRQYAATLGIACPGGFSLAVRNSVEGRKEGRNEREGRRMCVYSVARVISGPRDEASVRARVVWLLRPLRFRPCSRSSSVLARCASAFAAALAARARLASST